MHCTVWVIVTDGARCVVCVYRYGHSGKRKPAKTDKPIEMSFGKSRLSCEPKELY